MTSGSQLILVKHSLPEVKESIPASDWELSAEGRVRAERLAWRLKPCQPGTIVSSVERKAIQTAGILARNLGLQFSVANGLHEHEHSGIPFHANDEFQSLER